MNRNYNNYKYNNIYTFFKFLKIYFNNQNKFLLILIFYYNLFHIIKYFILFMNNFILFTSYLYGSDGGRGNFTGEEAL